MATEAVTIAKFFKGLATKKTAVKSLAFGFWIGIFALIIYVGCLLWQRVMRDTENYKADKMVNFSIQPTQTWFGCNRFVIRDPEVLKPLIRIGTDKRQGTQKK